MNFDYELANFIDFRNKKVCDEVRDISKDEITEHEKEEFNIRIIENKSDFYSAFATDLVKRIKESKERGEDFAAILPVGPVPQFKIAAEMINKLEISCDHVHTFNMDEYANEKGQTVPPDWEGSFQKVMRESFFKRIDENLRPPEDQIHFPTSGEIDSFEAALDELGGADICYGGIGWCGHIAFIESHWGKEFEDNLEGFKKEGAKVVELHPMTIMQNALHSFDGDWSLVPPKAVTIGPKQIMEADHRSFWLDGYIGGGISWQRFIARLSLHGPVTPVVPATLLQTEPTDVTLLGKVAEDVKVEVA